MSTQIEVDTLSTVSFKLNDESKKPFRSDDFVMIEPIVSADAFTMSQGDELSLSRKQKQKSYIFGWVESVPSVHNDQALVIKTFFGGKGGTLRLGEIQKTLQRKNARLASSVLSELAAVLRELSSHEYGRQHVQKDSRGSSDIRAHVPGSTDRYVRGHTRRSSLL